MTNNPTIDGVSRELIQRILAWLNTDDPDDGGWVSELRALLDAPAVERQEPIVWAYCPECGCEEVRHEEGAHKQCAECHQEWFSDVNYTDVVRKHLGGKFTDLQSTIDRLEARITQLESEAEFAAATYQASRDRIAELESGRGEPVANCFERRNGAGEWVNDSKVWIEGSPCSGILKECEKYPDLYRIRLAYTAPPAPVAVVMPDPVGEVVEFGKGLKEVSWVKGKLPGLGSKLYTSAPALLLPGRRTADDFQSKNAQYDCADALADTWNACLDATAALNNQKPADLSPGFYDCKFEGSNPNGFMAPEGSTVGAEWHDVAGDDEGLAQ